MVYKYIQSISNLLLYEYNYMYIDIQKVILTLSEHPASL